MIRILKMKHLQWRNVCSREPVVVAELALGSAFDWTGARLSEPILKRMREQLPGLRTELSKAGAAELVADIAQELQALGDVPNRSSGVLARDDETGTALIFFSYRDPFLAQAVLVAATAFVTKLARLRSTAAQLSQTLSRCIEDAHRFGLKQSTCAIIHAAAERGIPWFRISHMSEHIQLGQGTEQRRMGHRFESDELDIGDAFSRNKLLTFSLLSELQLPTGRHAPVNGTASTLRTADAIGYPLIVKPIERGKRGKVFANLRNPQELRAALLETQRGRTRYLVQSFFTGNTHRMLVVEGKLISGVRIIPLSVTGDGKNTIDQLITIENRNPRKEPAFTNGPTAMALASESEGVLARQVLNRDDIPNVGQVVRVGETALDVTEIVHIDIVRAAERAAKALGLRIASVNFISSDITRSWREVGGGICDVNAGVRLRPYWLANPHRDVAGRIIESIYPKGKNGRIPTAMITGTVGKTTTSLMLKSILTAAGHIVGAATTVGAAIGDEEVVTGDVAGINGAAVILRDPTVTAAVLETARGDLLKTGMYLDRCDVAALLNVGREQIGIDGIDTLDQMAEHKRKVIDAATAAAVLNADDKRCLTIAREIRDTIRTILFSATADAPDLREHIERGGEGIFVTLIDGRETIVIESRLKAISLVAVGDMPATMGGLITPNVWNAMAACGLAIGLGVELQHIGQGLRQYQISYAASRGRFNFPDGFPVKILFDRAFSPPALAAAMPVVNAVKVPGRRICAAAVPGNRPIWHLEECASYLAGHFDEYVCYELADRRGRNPKGTTPGELAARLARSLALAGVDVGCIKVVRSREDAARTIANTARAGDFVAIFGPGKSIEEYRAAFAATTQASVRMSCSP